MISLAAPLIVTIVSAVIALALVVVGHVGLSRRRGGRAGWIVALVIGYVGLVSAVVFGLGLLLLGDTLIPAVNDFFRGLGG